MRFGRESAAAGHDELLASIRRTVEVREKHKDRAAENLVKLRKVYEKARKVRVKGHVAEWGEVHDRVAVLSERSGKSDLVIAGYAWFDIGVCAGATPVKPSTKGVDDQAQNLRRYHCLYCSTKFLVLLFENIADVLLGGQVG